MGVQNSLLSEDALAAILWLGMPDGTPFPLAKATPEECPRPAEMASGEMPLDEIKEWDEQAIPAHDPAAWAEDFHRWAFGCCVYRDRHFGGIGALHTDFCQWTNAHESVPCTRMTFEALLRDQGFFFADGLVYGLLLKEDWGARPEALDATAEAQRKQAKSRR